MKKKLAKKDDCDNNFLDEKRMRRFEIYKDKSVEEIYESYKKERDETNSQTTDENLFFSAVSALHFFKFFEKKKFKITFKDFYKMMKETETDDFKKDVEEKFARSAISKKSESDRLGVEDIEDKNGESWEKRWYDEVLREREVAEVKKMTKEAFLKKTKIDTLGDKMRELVMLCLIQKELKELKDEAQMFCVEEISNNQMNLAEFKEAISKKIDQHIT